MEQMEPKQEQEGAQRHRWRRRRKWKWKWKSLGALGGLSLAHFKSAVLFVLVALDSSSWTASKGPTLSTAANLSVKKREVTNDLERQEAGLMSEKSQSTIRLTRFQVPSVVRVGELRRLTCQYEIEQATLHAMKLFKDNKEFYRFTPNEEKQDFPVPGVQVDLKRSNYRDIWLKINRRSSGQYKCQVLVEGTFNSVSAEKRMEVQPDGPLQSQAPNLAGNHTETGSWPQSNSNTRPKAQGQQVYNRRTGFSVSNNNIITANSNSNANGKSSLSQAQQKAVQPKSSSSFNGLHMNSGAQLLGPATPSATIVYFLLQNLIVSYLLISH